MKKLISLLTKIFPRQVLIKFSYLFSILIRPFYWGNKVECPVCGKHFRKFLPYGYGEAMDNRLCPNCLSLERHRLLWLYLKEKTGFFLLFCIMMLKRTRGFLTEKTSRDIMFFLKKGR